MMRASRQATIVIGVIVACVVAGFFALLLDPLPRMRARRSQLARAVEGATVIEKGQLTTPVRVTATSGLSVDILVRRAQADSGRRLPVVVILGGNYKAQQSVELVGDTPGLILVGASYPYAGDPRPDALTFLRDIPAIRAAFLDTPPALLVTLDYVLSRPDVDTTRVEGVGVSLGAPFMCIAGALDRRISRVWAVHGSGGSYVPLESNMRPVIRFAPLRALAAAIATVIIDGPRLDPARWVGRISPRPFVMLNAEGDERLPRAAVERLYRSARAPKELIWMPGGHVHGDSETINAIARILLGRIEHGRSTLTRSRD